MLQALKRDRNEKENGHIEQMILLNQAKEKLDELKIELKEAKQEAKTLEEKINTRNAQIVKLGRGYRLFLEFQNYSDLFVIMALLDL